MINVYTDGGSRGNPGHAASAVVIYSDKKIIYKEGKYLGVATNNIAEYTALLMAVNWLAEKGLTSDVNFHLDSELVVKQLNGSYRVKNKKLLGIYSKIKNSLTENFKSFLFTHVPREHNKMADNIVNNTLNENNLISR